MQGANKNPRYSLSQRYIEVYIDVYRHNYTHTIITHFFESKISKIYSNKYHIYISKTIKPTIFLLTEKDSLVLCHITTFIEKKKCSLH